MSRVVEVSNRRLLRARDDDVERLGVRAVHGVDLSGGRTLLLFPASGREIQL